MFRLSWLPFLLVAAIFSGCGRDEDLRVYDAEKSTRPVVFNTPDGWHRSVAREFERYAWEAVEAGQTVRITISYLDEKRADLLDNYNRWRVQQLFLPAATASEMEQQLKQRTIDGLTVHLVDIQSAESALRREVILGAIFTDKKRTWFLKLRGPLEAARAQQSTFDSSVPRAVAAIKHAVREPTEEELAHGD